MLIANQNRTEPKGIVNDSLIARIAADDRSALETLYTETRSAVYGFILSIIRNPHTAEDIMQETYIQVYVCAPGYRAKGKPMAWIFTIARNLSLMKLREKSASDLPLEMATLRGSDGPESALDRMVLDLALTHLGEQERQIIMLHDVAGLKHREIAEILSLPLPTVLSKYHRALSKLKKLVKEDMRDGL